jgi:hypothetical protein
VVAAQTYKNELATVRQIAQTGGGTFGTFYMSGTSHTCLRGPCYQGTQVNGVSTASWLGDLLAAKGRHIGP